MQIPRPTDADKQRFRHLVPEDPRIEIKPMFGNLGAFIQGNMFMGLFGSEIGVKLRPADQDQVRAAGGTSFGPSERPMNGYVSLPGAARSDQLEAWIASALAYVSEQPPKAPKGPKRRRT
ncbi:TfoX/Sxy family protein [Microlunatus ginsengisoli]|uniref:TfoX N-terminal domain-containing protein n=1 Tax=Microlunatus ginsengisoli TaxID=363863 RepID=A0ABP7ALI1_9ACTN